KRDQQLWGNAARTCCASRTRTFCSIAIIQWRINELLSPWTPARRVDQPSIWADSEKDGDNARAARLETVILSKASSKCFRFLGMRTKGLSSTSTQFGARGTVPATVA